MERLAFPLALLLSMALALPFAGCGSGESAEIAAPPRLTKAQLAHRMTVICEEHTAKKFTEIGRWEKKQGLPLSSKGDVPDAQWERELMQIQIPDVREAIRELERLQPPKAQEKTFEAFLKAAEYGVEFSKKDPSWYPTGYTEPFSKAKALSWKLGTAVCIQA